MATVLGTCLQRTPHISSPSPLPHHAKDVQTPPWKGQVPSLISDLSTHFLLIDLSTSFLLLSRYSTAYLGTWVFSADSSHPANPPAVVLLILSHSFIPHSSITRAPQLSSIFVNIIMDLLERGEALGDVSPTSQDGHLRAFVISFPQFPLVSHYSRTLYPITLRNSH
jgi:hypothetical protein